MSSAAGEHGGMQTTLTDDGGDLAGTRPARNAATLWRDTLGIADGKVVATAGTPQTSSLAWTVRVAIRLAGWLNG